MLIKRCQFRLGAPDFSDAASPFRLRDYIVADRGYSTASGLMRLMHVLGGERAPVASRALAGGVTFKRFKSLAGWCICRSAAPTTAAQAWLYGKLLVTSLAEKLASRADSCAVPPLYLSEPASWG